MQDNKLHNYDAIVRLAENPRDMASRILALEARAKEWKIGTDPQRKAGLLAQLESLIEKSKTDAEDAHIEADDLLLEFINDEKVSELYGKIEKWYKD